jgi:hypothetical protein
METPLENRGAFESVANDTSFVRRVRSAHSEQ